MSSINDHPIMKTIYDNCSHYGTIMKQKIDKECNLYIAELEKKATPIIHDFQTLASANSSHVDDLISYVKTPFETIRLISLGFFAGFSLFFCKYSILGAIGVLFSGVVLYNTHKICVELDTLQKWVFTYKEKGKHLPLNDTIDKTKIVLTNIWNSTHIKPLLEMTFPKIDFTKKFNENLQKLERLKASRFKQFFGGTGTLVAGFIFGKDWSFSNWFFGK